MFFIRAFIPIVAIAVATLLEAVRSRLLWVSVIFAVVLVGVSVSAASVALFEQARIIVDVGLAACSGLGSAIAIAVALNAFAGELKNRTAYVVLTRPLPRGAYVLGKFLGLWTAMALVVLAMGLATAAVTYLFNSAVPAAFWPALGLSIMEMGVVLALALLFSTLAVPTLAATYAACVVVAGNLSADIAALAHRKGTADAAALWRGIYYLLPDLARLSLRPQAANNLAVEPGYVLAAALYGTSYAAVVLVLAMAIFSRRRVL